MTAFKKRLKIAIPHSMRRNVLNPRLTLWPRTLTRIVTAIAKTTSNQTLSGARLLVNKGEGCSVSVKRRRTFDLSGAGFF
jgi:hypothetical protein